MCVSLLRYADCMYLEMSIAFISVKADERSAVRSADAAAGRRPKDP